jgi:SPX domain protein involved in polyphosphate accumulation
MTIPQVNTRETRDFAREIKFLIDARRAPDVLEWARGTLAPDPSGEGPHGDEYATTSLYFETPNFDVYRRRGSYGRAKYRVRRYGMTDFIFLERKFRSDRLLAKRRTTVPLEDLERLGEQVADPAWAGYWFHRRVLTRGLRPLVQMCYERTARLGTSSHGTIRFTLDRDLRVLPLPDRAFIPGTGLPLIPEHCILELKYRVELPAVFRQLVEKFALSVQPVSKFRLGLGALDYAPAFSPGEGSHG